MVIPETKAKYPKTCAQKIKIKSGQTRSRFLFVKMSPKKVRHLASLTKVINLVPRT